MAETRKNREARRVKSLKNQYGMIKPLITIALLVAAVYAGYRFGMPYYRYAAFKSDVKEIARMELGDAERTRKQVYETAQEFKIPIEEQDIEVVKKEKTVRVRTAWSVDVDLFGIYRKTLPFEVDVEE